MLIRSIPSVVYLIFVCPAVVIWCSSLFGLFSSGMNPILLDKSSDCLAQSTFNGPSAASETTDTSFRRDIQLWTDPMLGESEFDRIIVINLAQRQDRRDHMNLMARALGIELEFFNATSFTNTDIVWIQERLWEDWNGIIWNGTVGSEEHPIGWRDFYRRRLAESGLEKQGQEELRSVYPSSFLQEISFPLVSSGVTSLPGPLACWVSHLAVLKSIVDRGFNRTLILEDDVDLAWDFRRSWSLIAQSLPKDSTPAGETVESGDWEMVYLGYSFSDETANRPVHHPYVRPSDHPLGTFGYALSQTGAKRILEFLQNDERLFTKPVDWAFADYIPESRRNGRGAGLNGGGPDRTADGPGGVFSLSPPLVGHGRYEFGTDIGGASNAWKTWLADSTMNRLETYERVVPTDQRV